MALAKLCFDTLMEEGVKAKLALEAGACTEAVEKVIEANTLLSGIGFESGGLAGAHAIHNGLTVLEECHHMYHGEKVAFGTITQLVLENIPSEEIQSKDVYDAAVKGDKLALEIFEFTGKVLGTALANFVAFSSPEAIILFGGLAKSGDYIMKPIQKALEENVLNIYKGKTKLLLSQLKDADAAVLGASALGWEVRES